MHLSVQNILMNNVKKLLTELCMNSQKDLQKFYYQVSKTVQRNLSKKVAVVDKVIILHT